MKLPIKNTKVVNPKYNKDRPLITIRSSLPKEILAFVKRLKRLNKASGWINEAMIEKWERENKSRKK